jgi:hypothetical protein
MCRQAVTTAVSPYTETLWCSRHFILDVVLDASGAGLGKLLLPCESSAVTQHQDHVRMMAAMVCASLRFTAAWKSRSSLAMTAEFVVGAVQRQGTARHG